MADFLTRLIERSRDLSPQGERGQEIKPLIAPFFATGPNTSPTDDVMNDVMGGELTSIAEPESRRQTPAPRITEAASGQRPERNISIAPLSPRHESKDKVSPEIKPARALAHETRDAQLNQTPRIKPLPQAMTPKSTLAPANDRPGLTSTAADQSRRATTGPLVIRPQRLQRADESTSRANEAANDDHAPIIRVTIGRVDVRAVTQAAPPARRATRPAPKLSLEEYLRTRNGRK